MPLKKRAKLSETLETNIVERIERITKIGHWVLETETGKLFWSEQVFDIHGLSPDFYTPDVMTAIGAYVEEDREYVSQCMERAIETGESFVFQCRIRRVDAEIRTVIASGECEVDNNKNVIKVFGTFQDITDLKEEQERYELAISASNTAIWDWDIKKDEILWYGASASVLGYQGNETLPQSSMLFYNDLLTQESQKKLKKAFAEHFQTRNEFEIELEFIRKANDHVWMMARGRAQWDESGRAVRIIGSLTNIHDMKKAQSNLLRSNNDLEQFASIAAHDLQQPLRSISGFLDILRESYADSLDDQAHEYISYAIKGAEDMSALITDLLEYSRLETDGVKSKDENVNTILQNAIRHLQSTINDTQTSLQFKSMPTIRCDAHKLQRVFYNLIENAIKYRGEKPPVITIECRQNYSETQFTVRDNGIGIKHEKLHDIFGMFQRLHNKSKYSGTGIGLAICKKIVELHGGKIWAESEIGEGTTFHFTIPEAHLEQEKDA